MAEPDWHAKLQAADTEAKVRMVARELAASPWRKENDGWAEQAKHMLEEYRLERERAEAIAVMERDGIPVPEGF